MAVHEGKSLYRPSVVEGCFVAKDVLYIGEDILWKDVLVSMDVLYPWTFCGRTFCGSTFCTRTFCRQGRFVEGRFVKDVL
jgi:hypothetical protein